MGWATTSSTADSPLICPRSNRSSSGGGLLRQAEDFAPLRGLSRRAHPLRPVKALLESVEGFTKKQLLTYDLIPGDRVIREFIGGSTIKIPHNE